MKLTEQDKAEQKAGKFQMLIMDRTIVIISRKWRSKWWSIHCVGCKGKRRQDGSCKHERLVLDSVAEQFQGRVRIER